MLQNVGGVWYKKIYQKNDQDDIQKVKSFTTKLKVRPQKRVSVGCSYKAQEAHMPT